MTHKRILIVDDEPNLCGLLKLHLMKTGRYEILTEVFPSRVISVARSFLPDMILLDIDMPGKDGGEVLRELRAQPALAKVPVLFLTSLVSGAEAGQHEIKRGTERFLAKPVDPAILVGVVERMIHEVYASAS